MLITLEDPGESRVSLPSAVRVATRWPLTDARFRYTGADPNDGTDSPVRTSAPARMPRIAGPTVLGALQGPSSSTNFVSYRPSRNAGASRMRRWSGIEVLIPSITYIESARFIRSIALSRVDACVINLATSES